MFTQTTGYSDDPFKNWPHENALVDSERELHRIIGNELDPESVIRRSIRHVMDRIGASDLGTFVREGLGDWENIGYVNYQRLRNYEDAILPDLATRIPYLLKQLQRRNATVLNFTSGEEIENIIGSFPGASTESHMLVVAAPNADNPALVFVAFRNHSFIVNSSFGECLTGWCIAFDQQLRKASRVDNRRILSED